MRLSHYQFQMYRQIGDSLQWSRQKIRRLRVRWKNNAYPPPGIPNIFRKVGMWTKIWYRRTNKRRQDIAGASVDPAENPSISRSQLKYREFRDWFGGELTGGWGGNRAIRVVILLELQPDSSGNHSPPPTNEDSINPWRVIGPPKYQLKKPLGWGGNGMALHYVYHNPTNNNPPQDIVVKFSTTEWANDYLLIEERTTNVS